MIVQHIFFLGYFEGFIYLPLIGQSITGVHHDVPLVES